MSRYHKGPAIARFKPASSRFANAPWTPEYNAAIWEQLQRYAPDKVAGLIDKDHDEALRLNAEREDLNA